MKMSELLQIIEESVEEAIRKGQPCEGEGCDDGMDDEEMDSEEEGDGEDDAEPDDEDDMGEEWSDAARIAAAKARQRGAGGVQAAGVAQKVDRKVRRSILAYDKEAKKMGMPLMRKK